MSETKFTPGPWEFQSFSFGSPDAPIRHKKIVGASTDGGVSRNMIAEVHMNHPNHEADGHLLAAAPELYESLEEARELFEMIRKFTGGELTRVTIWREKAEKALKAARGEAL